MKDITLLYKDGRIEILNSSAIKVISIDPIKKSLSLVFTDQSGWRIDNDELLNMDELLNELYPTKVMRAI